MENTEKRCSGCGGTLKFLGQEQIQLGQYGLLTAYLSNLISGALDVDIWECPDCGKLEFYRQGSSEPEDHMAQTICPKCGLKHDLDDPKCPGCGLKNPNYS